MKKPDMLLREYFSNLSEDVLNCLDIQLQGKTSDDTSEALNFLCKNEKINQWMESANNYEQFYNMIDTLKEYSRMELNKRK